jgi:hypothetical protein
MRKVGYPPHLVLICCSDIKLPRILLLDHDDAVHLPPP